MSSQQFNENMDKCNQYSTFLYRVEHDICLTDFLFSSLCNQELAISGSWMFLVVLITVTIIIYD
jgi:hypothetical protein